jgi:putative ABC transport system permease protein
MTILAIGMVVWLAVQTFGFAEGLERALRIAGDPLDLLVLRQGSEDETGSTIATNVARDIANLPGIARTENGEPLCSIEFVTILNRPKRVGSSANMIVRGMDPIGRHLRSNFQIVEGRDLRPGVNEVITSEKMAHRFQNLKIGEQLEINKSQFTVVGYFTANGSSAESEVWTDRRDLTSARRIPDAIASVSLRCVDDASLTTIKNRLEKDDQFKLKAIRETEYFAAQQSSSEQIKVFAFVIAGFLVPGAMFAAANTMYAAVAGRAREIGTLRALGFPRKSILISFMLEAVLICLAGGLLGCLATLPFNGMSDGTANWATFSEITYTYQFGPRILILGVVIAVVMGLAGGLFPAIRAVRLKIVDSLRQV